MADRGMTPPEPGDRSMAEIVTEISEKASLLVREEIELAKAEIAQKANRLLRGSVVAVAAGVFALLALAMVMHGVAWLINDLFFDDSVWAGFLIEAGFFVAIAAAAGVFAHRALTSGPPTPDMAIEQARLTRQALERDNVAAGPEKAA